MLPELPDPSPKPIEWFSPTLANDLLACPRRVGFARDPSFASWKRPSTFSVLGEAAHAVAEFAAKNNSWHAEGGERRRQLEAVWSDRINDGARKLAKRWAPAVPPPPEEWPGYHVTRVRTLRRAERAVTEQHSAKSKVALRSCDFDGSIGTEIELTDPTSGLAGRADRIDRVDGSYRVVDLKTGMGQDGLKVGQLRQLLLYAVLVQRATKEWPADIAVENASGEQFVHRLEPAQAEAALREASQAVRAFNAQVTAKTSRLEARPSADTCRWCAYRTCCDDYWRNLHIEWEHPSVLGSIVRTGTDAKGAHADIEVIAPIDLGSSTTHIAGLPEAPSTASTWLAAVDLYPIREPRSLRARWSSRIAAW